ncbi:hypothetical protein I6L80_15555 [Providencia rettgeri]|nr:hypothetical protein I6L80_15555 [Providencia rettgeri]
MVYRYYRAYPLLPKKKHLMSKRFTQGIERQNPNLRN